MKQLCKRRVPEDFLEISPTLGLSKTCTPIASLYSCSFSPLPHGGGRGGTGRAGVGGCNPTVQGSGRKFRQGEREKRREWWEGMLLSVRPPPPLPLQSLFAAFMSLCLCGTFSTTLWISYCLSSSCQSFLFAFPLTSVSPTLAYGCR